MTTDLKVETFRTESIKPSSPTPLNLKTFELSLLDRMTPPMYIPLIFWYTGNAAADDRFLEAEERFHRMKKSLSETLTRFYPFAGRISDCLIDCNDEGVDYIEARVNCVLHDILKPPNGELLAEFLPIQTESNEAATGRLLLVKVNFFECGGMAVGVCLSHKIADLYTLSKFVNTWAAITRGSNEAAVFPEFGCATSFLPPQKDLSFTIPAMEFNPGKGVSRRFVFDSSKIPILKACTASTTVPQPTRVEAVTALIWKCAIAASPSPSPSVLRQVVNLRKRVNPPLPENAVGYLVSYFTVNSPESTETESQVLVKRLRDGIREFSENYVKKLEGSDAVSTIFEAAKEVGNLSRRDDIKFYNSLSWCRFGVYEADFGWGKPTWVSVKGAPDASNIFLLMDGRDGEGIEAWVWLNEAEMGLFERNHELLAFASVNPSVHC
ncbi:hypothetical protein F3Y22_tig00003041pilonHSYRG00995 [Hibiscus syriacus]|uniref:BAHD acyltransferase n=2 Tax=Hibiscus syriacus TaxID=106335 RepID=A0A6A3CL70_HIBSY|nr:hypothetical protein F3Y22_tig00003041pilonHSYRG00995 [Hibiscus syriacus]